MNSVAEKIIRTLDSFENDNTKLIKPNEVYVDPPTPKKEVKKVAGTSVSVKPFTHDGIRYYKSSDDILYDKAEDPQGLWDETTKTINQIAEDDIEDEEDSDSDDEEEA